MKVAFLTSKLRKTGGLPLWTAKFIEKAKQNKYDIGIKLYQPKADLAIYQDGREQPYNVVRQVYSFLDYYRSIQRADLIFGNSVWANPYQGMQKPLVIRAASVWKQLIKDTQENNLLHYIWEGLESYLVSANAIIANSTQVKNDILKNYQISSNKIKVVLNGVNQYHLIQEKCRGCGKYQFKNSPTLYFTASGLGSSGGRIIKGFDRALNVFAKTKLNKIALGIAGGQEKFLASQFEQAKARFIPNFPNEHLNHIYLQNPGIYLFVSRHEGCSNALNEAVASGLVPIGFRRVGQAQDIIINGKNGFLVDNVGQMIKRINFLSQNPALFKKMQKEIVKTAVQKLNWNKCIDNYLKIFAETYRDYHGDKN